MFLRVGFVVAAWLLAATAFGEPTLETVYEIRKPTLLHRYELMTSTKFTFQEVKDRALGDLKRLHRDDSTSKLRLIRISYFTDRQDLERTAAGKGTDSITFEYWKSLYDQHGAPALPAADLVEINRQAVLRYRSGEELVTKVLSSTASADALNPLSFEVKPHGAAYEILEFVVADDGSVDGSVECYAKYLPSPKKMEAGDARVLAVNMARKLDVPVKVYLREDIWFIRQPDFPIAYRFERSEPPNKTQFEESVTYSAVSQGSGKEHELYQGVRKKEK